MRSKRGSEVGPRLLLLTAYGEKMMENKSQQEDQPTFTPRGRREEKKGSLSRWLAWIFGILFVVSVGINIILAIVLAVDMVSAIEKLMKVTPKEKDYREVFVSGTPESMNKILLVPIEGLLMDESEGWFMPAGESLISSLRKKLDQAANDNAIKAVILEVNSPGGSITTSELIRHELARFKKKRRDVQIVGLMKDVAASGGYYIMMPCDYIIAHETSITGSIGVISKFINVEGLCEKIGVKFFTIQSRERKDMGSPFREMTPEERQLFKAIVDEMYEKFLKVVEEGRKGKLTRKEILDLADGMVYTGKQALEKKLVDEIGFFDNAVEKAMELARLANAKVIKYSRPHSPLEWLFWSGAKARSASILPTYRDVLRQTSPKFMYLWWPVETTSHR